ncbi:helix-hairpin-helix domain-containing protein [Salarchaeum sp. JOR-1]|uniref:helix-hairpin-helix domain-containing protein n=1 Tax=Salarchaeum sp. JOR-1 TaxID=2599399 RepID=UPI001198BD09|nr:helix-hairpin-helix domain-containing protein [Salarchaeum sp. JOR-1]QDX39694.1 helix-hairpin-helix domain-containing protein [Salarchaeum sp. JOR-1]
MGLLSALKSMLGLGSDESGRNGSVDVTVEREREEEPVAGETDASASTESLVEEHVEDGEKVAESERAEPAEAGAGQPEAGDETADLDEAGPDTGGESEATPATDDEPVAEETDASASTESLVEEHVEDGEKVAESERAEPAEAGAGQPEADDETTDIDEVEPDAESESAPDEEGAEAVKLLKGIGPAYAERLHDTGVETVADLADADADELGDEIDVSPSRVQRWIDRAQERLP